ncbi:hypothetical protein ACWZEH_14290 [Streptomyces sp. QTS137]
MRFPPEAQEWWPAFTTAPTTLVEIITVGTPAEARTLISLCPTDADP